MASNSNRGVASATTNRVLGLPPTPKSQRLAQYEADLESQLGIARNGLSTDSLISDASSSAESDNLFLMDVEFRSSGPISALISTEIANQEDEEETTDQRCESERNAMGEKYSKWSVDNNGQEDVPEVTDVAEVQNNDKEVIANRIGNGSKHQSIQMKKPLDMHYNKAECFKNGAFNVRSELDKPTSALSDSMYVAEATELKQEMTSDQSIIRNDSLTNRESNNSLHHSEINVSVSAGSPGAVANNKTLDNAALSKLLEAALFEREENGETIPQMKDLTSLNKDFQSKSRSPCSSYNKSEYPKLKQMLTIGHVSNATKQFTEAMCTDTTLNYSNVSLLSNLPNHTNLANGKTGRYVADLTYIQNEYEIKSDVTVELKRSYVEEKTQGFSDMCPPSKKCKVISKQGDGLEYKTEFPQYLISQEYQSDRHQMRDVVSPSVSEENVSKVRTTIAQSTSLPNQNSPRLPPPAPLLPPCRVCGEKASGFHYGVNTCEACKGFFRRSLCRKEPYVCVSNGSCHVQSGRRTVCSHCRLKRCLDVGMSKTAIKTGRYTHELRSKNIMEVKSLQQQERGITSTQEEFLLSQVMFSGCNVKREPEANGELQDVLDTLMMAQTYLFEFLDDYYDTDMIRKRQMDVYNRYKQEKFDKMRNRAINGAQHYDSGQSEATSSISRDPCNESDESEPSDNLKEQVMKTIIEDMERGIQGLVMFAKAVPGFEDLETDDKSSLLKCSRFDIWLIGHIRCLNSDLRVGACEWYFHAEELEQVWGRKLVDMAFRLTDYGQKLNLTREETAALRSVSLTFPDRCILKHRDAVESIHAKMFDCFQYIASKRHPNFNKWLPDVINFLVYLRDFGIEFDKRSSKMNLEWPLIQKNPLLLEVFFS